MKMKRMKNLRLVLPYAIVRPWLFQIFSYRTTHVSLLSFYKTEKRPKLPRMANDVITNSGYRIYVFLAQSFAILDESLVVVFL
jgi:hypothetical protein